MIVQLSKTDRCIYWFRISNYMQVVALEVNNPAALFVRDIRITNIPLVRYSPVESLCTRGNLDRTQLRYNCPDCAQSFPNAVPGQTSCDWEQRYQKVVYATMHDGIGSSIRLAYCFRNWQGARHRYSLKRY